MIRSICDSWVGDVRMRVSVRVCRGGMCERVCGVCVRGLKLNGSEEITTSTVLGKSEQNRRKGLTHLRSLESDCNFDSTKGREGVTPCHPNRQRRGGRGRAIDCESVYHPSHRSRSHLRREMLSLTRRRSEFKMSFCVASTESATCL